MFTRTRPRDGMVSVCALGFALVLGTSGCQKHGSKDEGEQAEGEGGFTDEPSAPAKDDRIPGLNAGAVGLQPGYVDGALLYASWRAGAMQEVLQSVPVEPRDAKDLAELGAAIGVDLRVGDVLGHLGIDPNARVSLSVRPVVTWAAEVRQTLAQGGGVIDELSQGGTSAGGSFGEPKVVVEAPPPTEPPQIEPLDPDSPPVVEAPPVRSAAAIELERKAKSLGVHVRVHVPVANLAKLDNLLGIFARELRDERWATTCAALGPVRACGGESDVVVVVRDVPGGLQFDALLTFKGDYDHPDDEFRRAAIQQALTVPAATNAPRVAALRGDLVALVDGPGFVSAMRAAALARTVSSLGDSDEYWVGRQRGREEALRQLHETERMFEGVSLEVQLGDERVLATGRWLATDYGRQHMAEVFELSQVDADVPSISALCEGAMLCGRSRGLPARERFGALATGIYAQPMPLGELMDRYEEESAAVMFLETWPNAIGTLAKLPGASFEPPESFVVKNVIDLSSRVLGGGFSLRSLSQRGRSVNGDWVAYARMSSADLSAISGFMGMAEVRLAPTSIPEVAGRVEFATIPDSEVGGNYYAVFDPSASTGDWGWSVIADGDDRVRWLLSRARDDGSVPLVYAEIGDLWRLVSAFEEGREELGFAQSWLSRRWVRAQVGLDDDGAPVVRMAMGKLD